MSVAYDSHETYSQTGGGTSVPVSVPSGITDGDLLIAFIATDNDSGAAFTAPAGWTTIEGPNGNNSSAGGVYYRVASSEPSSYTWTVPSSDRRFGAIIRVTGADTLDPINDSASDTDTGLSPAVTTTVSDCLILSFMLHGKGTTHDRIPPTGFTAIYDVNTGLDVGISTECAWDDAPTAGSNGPYTWSSGGGAGHSFQTFTVAVAPLTATSFLARRRRLFMLG